MTETVETVLPRGWDRLSTRDRMALARAGAIPRDFLTDQAATNLGRAFLIGSAIGSALLTAAAHLLG